MAKNMGRMTKKDVCRAFGISLTALNNWILKGCPVIREGRNVFFSLQKIIEWKEQRLHEAQKCDSDFEKSRAEKELWRARTVKLNYERLEGSLVPAKDVREAAFEKARLLRDQLLNIPNRIAPILAAERDTVKVRAFIDKEIRDCLIDFVDTMSKGIGKTEDESEGKNESSQK